MQKDVWGIPIGEFPPTPWAARPCKYSAFTSSIFDAQDREIARMQRAAAEHCVAAVNAAVAAPPVASMALSFAPPSVAAVLEEMARGLTPAEHAAHIAACLKRETDDSGQSAK